MRNEQFFFHNVCVRAYVRARVCVQGKVDNLGADGMMMRMMNSNFQKSTKLLEIIVVVFGVIDQLLIRYCAFVK